MNKQKAPRFAKKPLAFFLALALSLGLLPFGMFASSGPGSSLVTFQVGDGSGGWDD